MWATMPDRASNMFHVSHWLFGPLVICPVLCGLCPDSGEMLLNVALVYTGVLGRSHAPGYML